MEIFRRHEGAVRVAVFDFDGTISTLRRGWEDVMLPLMEEALAPWTSDAGDMARGYIDESTGIQTILQMKWLSETVSSLGGLAKDPWEYKAEYNARLMETVAARRDAVAAGSSPSEDWLVAGAREFLRGLQARGIRMFAASGTDQMDVRREAEALGVAEFFQRIDGALPGSESCAKEAALGRLTEGIPGSELAVIGDGKVEILLGNALGARTLGIASDEARGGLSELKRARLTRAQCGALAADFADPEAIYRWMGI